VLSNDKTEKELIKQLQDKVFEYLLWVKFNTEALRMIIYKYWKIFLRAR
jgi:hypothetical protein